MSNETETDEQNRANDLERRLRTLEEEVQQLREPTSRIGAGGAPESNVEWVDPHEGAAGINEALGPETIVRLKPGVYHCTEQIRIEGYDEEGEGYDVCNVVGAGGGTILRDETDSDEPLIYWGAAKGGGIRNLAIDGNRDDTGGGSAIFLDNHSGFLDISNLFIGMCANHGIHINGGYNITINQVRIGLDYHPTISRGGYRGSGGDTLGDGVHINADDVHPSRCELISVEVYFCEGHGYVIDHADNVDLFGCEANYCAKDGVRLQGVYGASVHGLDTEFVNTGLVVGESQHLTDAVGDGRSKGIGVFGGKNYDCETAIRIDAVDSMTVQGYLNAESTPTAITAASAVSNVVLLANSWEGQETDLSDGVTTI